MMMMADENGDDVGPMSYSCDGALAPPAALTNAMSRTGVVEHGGDCTGGEATNMITNARATPPPSDDAVRTAGDDDVGTDETAEDGGALSDGALWRAIDARTRLTMEEFLADRWDIDGRLENVVGALFAAMYNLNDVQLSLCALDGAVRSARGGTSVPTTGGATTHAAYALMGEKYLEYYRERDERARRGEHWSPEQPTGASPYVNCVCSAVDMLQRHVGEMLMFARTVVDNAVLDRSTPRVAGEEDEDADVER
jgi:hypothetical protein